LCKAEVKDSVAGDIVQPTGFSDAQIGETVADDARFLRGFAGAGNSAPTLKIYLGPNTSPFKGN